MSARSFAKPVSSFEPEAAVRLPDMPELKDVPFSLGASGRSRLRAENRELLQAAVVRLWPDAKIIAERVPHLKVDGCPMIEFSLAYHQQTGAIILRAQNPQYATSVYGAFISADPHRGCKQEIGIQDLPALAEVRNALLEQHGAKLGLN